MKWIPPRMGLRSAFSAAAATGIEMGAKIKGKLRFKKS